MALCLCLEVIGYVEMFCGGVSVEGQNVRQVRVETQGMRIGACKMGIGGSLELDTYQYMIVVY